MRIKVMVVALAGVLAGWAVHAEEAAPIEQVVISGDKLKRTEIDSSASVGARNRRQIDESGLTSLDEVASQMANVGTAENLPEGWWVRADLDGTGTVDTGDLYTFLTAFLAGC